MPLRIRHYKRGKKDLTYATLPIEEARNISDREVKKQLTKLYGKDYDYSKVRQEIKDFLKHNSNKYDISRYLSGPIGTANETILEIPFKKRGKFQKVLDDVMGRDVKLKSAQYLDVKKTNKNLIFLPAPLIHDVGYLSRGNNQFKVIENILENGFKAEGLINAYFKTHKKHRYNFDYLKPNILDGDIKITEGDNYTIELFSDEGRGYNLGHDAEPPTYAIKKSKPDRILSINVRLASGIPQDEKEKKMHFYKQQITEKYGVPVRFYDTKLTTLAGDEIQERLLPKKKKLEEVLAAAAIVLVLVVGQFFISGGITGAAVGVSNNSGNTLGVILFLIGTISAFFVLNKK